MEYCQHFQYLVIALKGQLRQPLRGLVVQREVGVLGQHSGGKQEREEQQQPHLNEILRQ